MRSLPKHRLSWLSHRWEKGFLPSEHFRLPGPSDQWTLVFPRGQRFCFKSCVGRNYIPFSLLPSPCAVVAGCLFDRLGLLFMKTQDAAESLPSGRRNEDAPFFLPDCTEGKPLSEGTCGLTFIYERDSAGLCVCKLDTCPSWYLAPWRCSPASQTLRGSLEGQRVFSIALDGCLISQVHTVLSCELGKGRLVCFSFEMIS